MNLPCRCENGMRDTTAPTSTCGRFSEPHAPLSAPSTQHPPSCIAQRLHHYSTTRVLHSHLYQYHVIFIFRLLAIAVPASAIQATVSHGGVERRALRALSTAQNIQPKALLEHWTLLSSGCSHNKIQKVLQ